MTLRPLTIALLTLTAVTSPSLAASVLVLPTDDTTCVQAVTGILQAAGNSVISANLPTLENPSDLVSNGSPSYEAVVLPDGDYSAIVQGGDVGPLLSSLVQYMSAGGRVVAVGRGAEFLAEKLFPALIKVEGTPSSSGTTYITIPSTDPLASGASSTTLQVYYDQNTPLFSAPKAVATYQSTFSGAAAVIRVYVNSGVMVLVGPHVHDQNGNPLDSDVILKNAVQQSGLSGTTISVSGVQVTEDSQGVYIDLQGISFGIPSGYTPTYAYLVLIDENGNVVDTESLNLTDVIEGEVKVGPLNLGPGTYYAVLEVIGVPQSGDDMAAAVYVTQVKVPGYVNVESVKASFGYEEGVGPVLTVECTGTVIGDTVTKVDVYLGTTQVGSFPVSLTGSFDWKETIRLSSVPSPGTYTVLLKLTTASGKTVEATTTVDVSYGVVVKEFKPEYVFLSDEKETGVRFLCTFDVVNTEVTKVTFYVDGTAVKTEDVTYGPGEYTIDETVPVQGLKYGTHKAEIVFTTSSGATFSTGEVEFEVAPSVMPTAAPAVLGLLALPLAVGALRRSQLRS